MMAQARRRNINIVGEWVTHHYGATVSEHKDFPLQEADFKGVGC